MRCKGMLFCSFADTKGTTPRIYLSGKCLHTPSKLGNRCAVAHAPQSLLPASACRALRPRQAQQRADSIPGIDGCWAGTVCHHEAAAPPTNVINSRQLTCPSHAHC